jgi:hypothetical protein
MKKCCNIKILVFAVLVCSFFSCTNDNIESHQQSCEVIIESFQYNSENPEIGLKSTYVDRGDAPSSVGWYIIRVENLDYPGIKPKREDFIIDDSWWSNNEKPIVKDVTEGLNRFTAESIGGDPQKGWKDVWRKSWGSVQYRVDSYSRTLKSSYPVYTIYKDTVESVITPNVKNNINFNMKPANGRLAIIVDSKKKNYAFGVTINGEWKDLYNNKCICYLLNDDTPAGTVIDVKIDFFKWNKRQRKWEHEKTENRSFDIEAGKNKTRLIDLR